jgi:hypothetical protein
VSIFSCFFNKNVFTSLNDGLLEWHSLGTKRFKSQLTGKCLGARKLNC